MASTTASNVLNVVPPLVQTEAEEIKISELRRVLMQYEQDHWHPICSTRTDDYTTIIFTNFSKTTVEFRTARLKGYVKTRSGCEQGLCIALLGPDGVGKSTAKTRLMAILRSVFPSQHTCHYRPRVIGRIGPGRPRSAPHALAPRSVIPSVAYALTVFVDNWFAYLTSFRPLLSKGGLVVFDRSYDDILIDPIRYRYGGPNGLIRFLTNRLPIKDNLYLVLDADPELILSRKTELAAPELVRQREAYRQWAARHVNAVVITSAADMDTTARKLFAAVVEYLTLRFKRNHSDWYGKPK
jgi:thymidylate kinase